MSVRALAWGVSRVEDDEEALVSLDQGSESVRVRWFCGDERAFTREGVAALIADVEAVADLGVWLTTKDRYSNRVMLTLAKGALKASDRVGDEGADEVLWDDVKKALNRAVKALPKPPAPAPEPAQPDIAF